MVNQLKDSGAKYLYASQELLNKAKDASSRYGNIRVKSQVLKSKNLEFYTAQDRTPFCFLHIMNEISQDPELMETFLV